ncbi:hypothetical protein MNBD_PLANCTO02-1009 [hydrothermal vent metagenome]|uniref:Type II secretion system protein GspF domain-containing protein n=1 Tax=hydrothermal vent metagenome TaxID=652676 RepID=A0A3B1DGN8_9ZZZZ
MVVSVFASIIVGFSAVLFAVFGRQYYFWTIDSVERDISLHLKKLRSNPAQLRLRLHLWVVLLGVIALTFGLIFDMFIIGLSLMIVLLILPWYLLRRMTQQRREKIESQLADTMISLSNSIRAGLSLPQAMGILADQSPAPISEEFRQIVGEYNLGKPLEQCLAETKEHLQSENFSLFAAAIEASRESGGRLNETIDRIAQSVREYQRLERKITAETSQARMSAVYMAIVPFAMLILYYFVVDPLNTERLFTTVVGQLLLCAAVFLDVIAYFWARAILSPDI